MEQKVITVQVRLDKPMLRSFALFDTLRLKKQWKRPALFSVIMLAFSAVCFLSVGRERSHSLGAVLLLAGVAMPVSYVLTLFNRISEQAKKLKLDIPRNVYTLAFCDESIDLINASRPEAGARLEWQKMGGAFRVKKAIYLYLTHENAFILPEGQATASQDELWEMIVKNLPEGRAYDKR